MPLTTGFSYKDLAVAIADLDMLAPIADLIHKRPTPKIREDAVGNIKKKWIPGTNGLNNPAVCLSADVCIVRFIDGEPDVVTSIRGKGKWQEGMTMLSAGGFVEPSDASVYDAACRERSEELKNLAVSVFSVPFYIGGPIKWNYKWDSSARRAVQTNVLAQNAAVATLYYLGFWTDGELVGSDEATSPRWTSIRELAERDGEVYAFDMTILLERLVKLFL
ncbi:hypothetical protein L0Y49_03875 [bacterium]|nr:hypothetical protein [bacterium]MCI0565908.1 hypothetical protein [bacterium]